MTALKEKALQKTPTGIDGLDEITYGGLPRGRTTLVCGSAGAGKTVLAMEFLVHGIREYGEPGVFMAFEETEKDLAANVASFGFDIEQMSTEGKLTIDHVFIDRKEIEETGPYDLEGIFIRLASAVEAVGAKRVVLDTIEVLFAGLKDEAIIRSELLRLFRWLKDRGLTAIVTGEQGTGRLSRFGLEEYVADCVILLDHRVTEEISTRRLRIVKYRGSLHGTDEYPILMSQSGISVLPLTSASLMHHAPTDRISCGVPDLDRMLAGGGFFRGSSILVSGTPGTGKTSLAATFVSAACERGERALFFSFEESKEHILRNMSSLGLELKPFVAQGLLHFVTVRPSSQGLESHLASMQAAVKSIDPQVVVVDPMTNFISVADNRGMKSMLVRMIDFLKVRGITAFFTHLANQRHIENAAESVSSIMDAWIFLRGAEHEGVTSYAISILKSRGMAHSHEIRQFRLSDNGIVIGDLYTKWLNANQEEPSRTTRRELELNGSVR